MLELYMSAIDGKTGDPFLDEINLGTGNYTNREYWLQVDEFRNGLYAESAMSRKILERAVRETKEAMVDAIFDRPDAAELRNVDFPDTEGFTRAEYLDQHMDRVWNGLGHGEYTKHEHQAWLLDQYTGINRDWSPPHWRMLKMRHEASQSKDAHALDNLFDRVREFVGSENGPEDFD